MSWNLQTPLCLVGMSGVGKSHWAASLNTSLGFDWHDCDRAIAERLGALVTHDPSETPVHAVGRWMGFPWEPDYATREAQYLSLEAEVTAALLGNATRQQLDAPQVLDTTGSVVHLPAALQDQLRARCHVVYLETPASDYARLRARYLSEPKPVIWQGVFAERSGESRADALGRCYEALLQERDRRYRRLADVVVSGPDLEVNPPTCREFLERIQHLLMSKS